MSDLDIGGRRQDAQSVFIAVDSGRNHVAGVIPERKFFAVTKALSAAEEVGAASIIAGRQLGNAVRHGQR